MEDLLRHDGSVTEALYPNCTRALLSLDCIEHRFSEARQQAAEVVRFIEKAADRDRFAIAAKFNARAMEINTDRGGDRY